MPNEDPDADPYRSCRSFFILVNNQKLSCRLCWETGVSPILYLREHFSFAALRDNEWNIDVIISKLYSTIILKFLTTTESYKNARYPGKTTVKIFKSRFLVLVNNNQIYRIDILRRNSLSLLERRAAYRKDGLYGLRCPPSRSANIDARCK